MVVPPNGQYILLCSPMSVILCAFWPSARHDLLAEFDQEFSSRAHDRTNTRESIKKLLSIELRLLSSCARDDCFSMEWQTLIYVLHAKEMPLRIWQICVSSSACCLLASYILLPHLIPLIRHAACLLGCEL